MRQHRISDDDAAALVTGKAPTERPELATLARSISEFRDAAFASPPRPSAGLRTRLDLAHAGGISSEAVSNEAANVIDAGKPASSRPRASVGRMKRMFAWFTGLGIAAKVVVGATVAAAAGATGVGAVTGVNILVSASAEQEQHQEQVTPGGDPTEAPADSPAHEPGTFGDSVSDRAHDLGKGSVGAEFGAEVSAEAQLLGEGNAHNPDGSGATGSASGNAGGGVEIAPELPDVVPGGDD
jgi:hypothetical protein